MIYFCADDYGLCETASAHIDKCIDMGALNKVSVFPNFDDVNLERFKKNVRVSLHLNLVEGKCMADAKDVDLLADKNGNFKNTFGGLLKLNLMFPQKFEEQVYCEIRKQVLFWKNLLPEGTPFCVDSHQHTHMIPGVFSSLLKVLQDEKIELEYLRIPKEPFLPYLKAPSLYFTYKGINVIKQWLLAALWIINKKYEKNFKIPTAYFLGILFSGEMDEKRVRKILAGYVKLAEKDGRDIEVLFHPGYLDKIESDFKQKNVVFEKFYISENRKKEFDSLIKLKERSVL